MSKTNFIESLISQDPSRSQCLQSVAEALWDAKYVCCNGMKLLASVLNVDKSAPMSMNSQAFLMHCLVLKDYSFC